MKDQGEKVLSKVHKAERLLPRVDSFHTFLKLYHLPPSSSDKRKLQSTHSIK